MLFVPGWSQASNTEIAILKSPDGKTIAQFTVDNQQHLLYRLQFKDSLIINWSRLGLSGKDFNLADRIHINKKEYTRHREVFKWPLGEDAELENNYNALTLYCNADERQFNVLVRLYNGSLAFRYVYHNKKNLDHIIHLNEELTEFNLSKSGRIYQYHEESLFNPVNIDQLPGISDLPSTIVTDKHLFLSIGEAENRSFTKSVLVKGRQYGALQLHFYVDTAYRDHKVTAIHRDTDLVFVDSLQTPWRTVSCAANAVGLHDFSQLNVKLVEPVSPDISRGVKPGKVFRVPISTPGALAGIDFAKKMNFQYILIDAGWYGAEFRTTSNPLQPIASMEIPRIIEYGKSNGIGVILYVNYVGLKAKLDSILPLYKKWGVSGIKFGFVDGGSQRGLSWLDTAMMKVNDYGMVLNVHDHYKPTGLSRRYPFNLSQEGIRGDENCPNAFHNMVLPFTRFLAGAADFTFCYPNERNSYSKNLLVSKGQQLALTVIYFDPLQVIFWYGHSEDYRINHEVEFFRQVPTVWDKTIYLAGEIGEYASVARRKDNIWYVGTATGLDKLDTTTPLDFLDKGKKYKATVYEDGEDGGIRVSTFDVKKGFALPVHVKAKCGQAIIIKEY